MKPKEINELISQLKDYNEEMTVKVWSNGANKDYPISHVGQGHTDGELDTYVSIVVDDDRNLVDLSKIWHDASEQPKPHFPIVYESGDEIKIYECTVLPCWGYWSEFASSFCITRWAYISELLPKGGEK